MDEIILEDGKYRFFMEDCILYCYRYGEPWREFCGDKAVNCLFDKCLEALKEKEE